MITSDTNPIPVPPSIDLVGGLVPPGMEQAGAGLPGPSSPDSDAGDGLLDYVSADLAEGDVDVGIVPPLQDGDVPLSPPSVSEDLFTSLRERLAPGLPELSKFGYSPTVVDPTGISLRAELRKLVRQVRA
jgi:hypothetical protein